MHKYPLVVDLDGTLIKSDLLHDLLLKLIFSKPLIIFLLLVKILKGKAEFKQYLSDKIDVEPALLPYNQSVLDLIKERSDNGSRIILCTASNFKFANKIASHLGIFDEVISSTSSYNCSGHNKRNALIQRFGEFCFDYVGNSAPDLIVWNSANKVYVCNANSYIVRKAKKIYKNIQVVDDERLNSVTSIFKAMRPHQWLKNILILIPVLTSIGYEFTLESIFSLIVAFFSLSFCASSVYILNDLVDLDNDRAHPRKKKRVIASGLIQVPYSLSLIIALLTIAFCLTYFLPLKFLITLIAYYVLTLLYSLWVKKIVLVDCFVLAFLYAMRIVAGANALDLPITYWLLLFSITFFLSLAFVKRYAEIESAIRQNLSAIKGRGYATNDIYFVQTLGLGTGISASLLFSLYLNSPKAIAAYQLHEFSLLSVPVLLFWISWVWLSAHKGRMHDDPVIFAIKDKTSLACGLLFVIVLIIARV